MAKFAKRFVVPGLQGAVAAANHVAGAWRSERAREFPECVGAGGGVRWQQLRSVLLLTFYGQCSFMAAKSADAH